MINLTYDDERLWELQREERAKLSWGPDIEDDFIALDRALKRRYEELGGEWTSTIPLDDLQLEESEQEEQPESPTTEPMLTNSL